MRVRPQSQRRKKDALEQRYLILHCIPTQGI
jgi:hypothetical protein